MNEYEYDDFTDDAIEWFNSLQKSIKYDILKNQYSIFLKLRESPKIDSNQLILNKLDELTNEIITLGQINQNLNSIIQTKLIDTGQMKSIVSILESRPKIYIEPKEPLKEEPMKEDPKEEPKEVPKDDPKDDTDIIAVIKSCVKRPILLKDIVDTCRNSGIRESRLRKYINNKGGFKSLKLKLEGNEVF